MTTSRFSVDAGMARRGGFSLFCCLSTRPPQQNPPLPLSDDPQESGALDRAGSIRKVRGQVLLFCSGQPASQRAKPAPTLHGSHVQLAWVSESTDNLEEGF